MTPDDDRPVNQQIAEQIRAALISHGPLTSKELLPHCDAAEDVTMIGRVIYDLRQGGHVQISGVSEEPTRNGKPAHTWMWVGPQDGALKPKRAPSQDKADPKRAKEKPAAKRRPATAQQPEMAEPVSYSVLARYDALLLTIADELLGANPVWQQARALRGLLARRGAA